MTSECGTSSLNLFLWFLHLSCKWLSIDWKDVRIVVHAQLLSFSLVLLASFSADLGQLSSSSRVLRKLVAIKVGCKWPLKVYVAREKNHFLQSTAAARKFSPQLKSHYHPQDIHPTKNSGRQKIHIFLSLFHIQTVLSKSGWKVLFFGGKNTSFR